MERTTVVLLRGMTGFSKLLWWEYFHGAPKLLEDMGFTVIVPPLPWGKRVAERSALLANTLKDVPGPLHLIAHSMGGVDARRYISHLGGHEKVVSLTTISTPHRGTSIADRAIANPFSPWRYMPAVADLTREAMQLFNESTPDVPGIVYRSYSAARPLRDQPWLVRPYGRRISEAEGPNDSQVPVISARWAKHVGTVQADHFELIGSHIWLNPFRHRPLFRHLTLYRSIGDWIHRFERERR